MFLITNSYRRVKFINPTGLALQAEKGVPGPCPWIKQGESEGLNLLIRHCKDVVTVIH